MNNNCLLVALIVKFKLRKRRPGKLVIMSWSGFMPHFGVKISDRYTIHFKSRIPNLPWYKMIWFAGDLKLRKPRKYR